MADRQARYGSAQHGGTVRRVVLAVMMSMETVSSALPRARG